MNINTLVAESLGSKLKGAGIAAGIGALGVGADVIRRKMAGDSFSDIGSAYANKAGEVKDTVKRAFQKKATMADVADGDKQHKAYVRDLTGKGLDPEIEKAKGMRAAANSVTRSEVEMNKVPKSKGIPTKLPNIIARGKINPDDAKTAEVADSLKRTKPTSGSSIYGGNLPENKPPKLGPRITNV